MRHKLRGTPLTTNPEWFGVSVFLRDETKYFKALLKHRSFRLWLVLLLSIDSIFIFLHILYGLFEMNHWNGMSARFSIKREFSYSEIYEYIVTFCSALMLMRAWRRYGQGCFLALAALFLYLTLDNAMGFHEGAGHLGQQRFGLDEVVGQLVLCGAVGAAFLGWIASTLLTAPHSVRSYAFLMLASLFVLAFFGVVVDAVDELAHTSFGDVFATKVLSMVEDGGELVWISICGVITLFPPDRLNYRATGALPPKLRP